MAFVRTLAPSHFHSVSATYTQQAIATLASAIANLKSAGQSTGADAIYQHLRTLALVQMSQRELDRIVGDANDTLHHSSDLEMHFLLAEKDLELAIALLELAVWPAQQSERLRLRAAGEACAKELDAIRKDREESRRRGSGGTCTVV